MLDHRGGCSKLLDNRCWICKGFLKIIQNIYRDILVFKGQGSKLATYQISISEKYPPLLNMLLGMTGHLEVILDFWGHSGVILWSSWSHPSQDHFGSF